MIPKCFIGTGVTGAARYVLGEGRGAGNDFLLEGETSRVAWIGGINNGWEIDSRERALLAVRGMEFDALNQNSRTRKCEKDAVHLMLAWRVGQTPDRAEMEEAARGALKAIGMENARAFWVAHDDEPHPHLHIVASKINPDTGRAYDLKGNYLKLSDWAEKWELTHGGIECSQRVENNRLRAAIQERDPRKILTEITANRATFTAAELDRELRKTLKDPGRRGELQAAILAAPTIVQLAEKEGGPVSRYSTEAVLASERQVLSAAERMERGRRHGMTESNRETALKEFSTIRPDQRAAFERATGAEGLSLIDGQAGTGKSYTIAAIRTAYEQAGFRVIGLAPTNAVAQDMGRDGFKTSSTIHAELFRLNNDRASWDSRTVVIVDEAAMVGTRLMGELMQQAQNAGAKLILVGDDRQLASIERGGMFGALTDRHGAASLTEVTRQIKHDDRAAAGMLAEGQFGPALQIFEGQGGITWTRTQEQARAALVTAWARDSAAAPDKSRFVFAYTNADVAEINLDIRAVRRDRGELGEDHLLPGRDGPAAFAIGDRVQFTATDKAKGLNNGAVATIQEIGGSRLTVRLDGRKGELRRFDAAEFQGFRHGYAGTIYKGQGRTLDQTYLYHSQHWRSAASYVALTRHRDKAELFVATNTARDLPTLARQMARIDDRRAASTFREIEPGDRAIPAPGRAGEAAMSDRAPPATPEEAAAQRAADQEAARFRMAGDAMTEQLKKAGQEFEQKEAARRQAAAEETQRRQAPAEYDTQAQLIRLGGQLQEMDANRRYAGFEAAQATAADQAQQDERTGKLEAQTADARLHGITDAGTRYAQALGQHYNVMNPYESLARAAMAEHAMFRSQQQRLDAQIAETNDPQIREGLQLRKQIESADYMALTSDRIAMQSRVITGRDGEGTEHERMTRRAADYREQATGLRQQYRAMQQERAGEELQPGRPATPAQENAPSFFDKAPSYFNAPGPGFTNRHSDLELLGEMHKHPEKQKELQEELNHRLAVQRSLGMER